MQIPKSNFSEWYNEIIKEAKLCDLRYNLKGFVVFMPWSVISMKKMYAIYEKALERTGHEPALFPALIPEESLTRESEHVAGFVPEVLWVTEAGNTKLEQRYALRPTSETAMYPMYSLWINGKVDLPLKIYQSCPVWRHETKATKPFIRSREFHWIEAHDVFATEKEAIEQVHEDMHTTEEVLHKRFGIPFLFFKRPQWDKFAGAVDTYAADAILPDGRALQLPSTHMLGQNFAKPFDVKYTDEKGENKYCWQTCYGPAISRIYAALISTHGDDKGLVLPFELAPVQMVIVPIYKGENQNLVRSECAKVEKELETAGFTVKLDDGEQTPGFKYNLWEMKGVPLRIEIGERDIKESSVMVARRDTKEKAKVKSTELVAKINSVAGEITKHLREKADKEFALMLGKAQSIEELNKVLDKQGGFVRVPFCSDRVESEQCADKVREITHANMRGSIFEGNREKESEKPAAKDKCVACGKKGEIYLYAARQY